MKINKWEKGNGEVIGFAIMAVAICSIIVIMVSILQMSMGLNAITKAANVVGRAAAVCTSKEDAEQQVQRVAENAVTYAGLRNLTTSVDYASSDHEWKSGNFIKVSVSADVKTISPLTPFRQEKSVLICIENLNGNVINIPSSYNGLPIAPNMQSSLYDEIAWNPNTMQRRIYDYWVSQGRPYEEGIAVLNGYYLIACTSQFGEVGERVQFELENGQILNCLVADAKSSGDSNYTNYGHISEGEIVCIEMQVDEDYHRRFDNPATPQWKPEWHSRPVRARNMGPYTIP